MAKVQALSKDEVAQAVEKLAGWSVRDGKLHAEFKFDDFVAAFAFMTKVALTAQCEGHHPEWSNVYNQVRIDLVTHDAGDAISAKDVTLAGKINELRSAA